MRKRHTITVTFSKRLTPKQARREIAKRMEGYRLFHEMAVSVWHASGAPAITRVTVKR